MRKEIYKGKIVNLRVETATLPNGAIATLEIISHPGAAAVVPFKDESTVILVRQYRHAIGAYIYEIPAGKLSPGENPKECAQRELEEEIGYTADTLEPVVTFLTTPGFTNEVIHIYKGTNLVAGTQNLGPDEIIEVLEMPITAAIAKIHDGTIRDGKTIVGLQTIWLQMGNQS
ncbi:MAG: ADP-ribose pyrophosphatase [Nitrospiraceae bacterium]|nr:ADP-ribose pyrophosphatase [Nitrospiraceae bacterium]